MKKRLERLPTTLEELAFLCRQPVKRRRMKKWTYGGKEE